MKVWFVKIYNEVIKIISHVDDINERVNDVLLAYDKIDEKENTTISFFDDKIKIISQEKSQIIKIKLSSRDIFQILHFCFSLILDNSDYLFCHGVVVSKENKGIFLLGDFGQGKTYLSLEFERQGYRINAADSILLKIEDDSLYSVYGSKKIVFEGDSRYLKKTNIKIKIVKVLILNGLCEWGKVDFKVIQDNLERYRKLFARATWAFTSPLTNYNNLAKLIPGSLPNFCKKVSNLSLPFIKIRGDSKKIIETLSKPC